MRKIELTVDRRGNLIARFLDDSDGYNKTTTYERGETLIVETPSGHTYGWLRGVLPHPTSSEADIAVEKYDQQHVADRILGV